MLKSHAWRIAALFVHRCRISNAQAVQFDCCVACQVPYTLVDEDIPDDWACEHNTWDPEHQSCTVPQALSDERIDEILLQQVQLEVSTSLGHRLCVVPRA